MNEIALSKDLKQIEFEINYHKSVAGQSVWEIGRRLNHVKENNLVHGEFVDWVNDIGLHYVEANRMMKVAKELPNLSTLRDLGSTALYLIATLPDEEKEEQLERIEQGDDPTVRELKELKKQLKSQSEKHQRELASKDEVIEKTYQQLQQAQNKPAEIIEKQVIPDDYEELKQANEKLSIQLNVEKQKYQSLIEQRKEQDENSRKYEELTQAIQEMEGNMTRTQKLIQTQKQVYELVDMSKELLMKIIPIPSLLDTTYVQENPIARRELEKIANQTQRFLVNLNDVLEEKTIIEGVYVDE